MSGGRQHQVGKIWPCPIFTGTVWSSPILVDDVVRRFSFDLKQPDDAVVLELLANRTNQNRTHSDLPGRTHRGEKEPQL